MKLNVVTLFKWLSVLFITTIILVSGFFLLIIQNVVLLFCFYEEEKRGLITRRDMMGRLFGWV